MIILSILAACNPADTGLARIGEVAHASPFVEILQPYSSFRDDEQWKPTLEPGVFAEKAAQHIATLKQFADPRTLETIRPAATGLIDDGPAQQKIAALNRALGFLWTAERFEGSPALSQAYGKAYLALQTRAQHDPAKYEVLAQVHIAGALNVWRFILDSTAPVARGSSPAREAACTLFDTAHATEAYHVERRHTPLGQGYNCLSGHRSWVMIPELDPPSGQR